MDEKVQDLMKDPVKLISSVGLAAAPQRAARVLTTTALTTVQHGYKGSHIDAVWAARALT
eukprot:1157118-Pelagomonas_calceolata.AAC.13